jgi:hypothetical protein
MRAGEASGAWHRCVLDAWNCAGARGLALTQHIRRASEHVNMRLFSSSLCFLLGSWLWSGVLAKSAVGDRILVVMEDEAQRGDYAQLWKDLESMPAPG